LAGPLWIATPFHALEASRGEGWLLDAVRAVEFLDRTSAGRFTKPQTLPQVAEPIHEEAQAEWARAVPGVGGGAGR